MRLPFPPFLFGRAWSPGAFLHEAVKLTHPFDREPRLPPMVASAIVNMARLGPADLAKSRQATLDKYYAIRDELALSEVELHGSLHHEVQAVVRNKNILLFKRLLEDISYDDMDVVSLLSSGIRLVGNLPPTGIWKKEDRRASCSVNTLRANAGAAQRRVLLPRSADNLDDSLWSQTMEEVESGSLVGPFSPDELSEAVGSQWIAARRFGVVQGEKIRPIDNFSEFSVNAAFGSYEKVNLKGLDQVVAWSKAWAESVEWARQSDNCFSLLTSQGDRVDCDLHPGWEGKFADLRGRVADLKSAYKQLARDPADSALSVIAVFNPANKKTVLFKALSMMFGETSAVYAFLRFSRAIAHIATKLFNLFVVEYFDDFTQIEPSLSASSAQSTLESLMVMLGWEIAMTEKKRLPFDAKFVCLGVLVDLSEIASGTMVLANKPGRVDALSLQVLSLLEKGTMGFKDALSIKGRISFAEGQLFGRIAAPAVRSLSRWRLT